MFRIILLMLRHPAERRLNANYPEFQALLRSSERRMLPVWTHRNLVNNQTADIADESVRIPRLLSRLRSPRAENADTTPAASAVGSLLGVAVGYFLA